MYLTYVALLMAGIDGILTKTHPGEALDKNLYDLPPEELKQVPTVCGSLREALSALDADRDFLKKGGVMDDDFINAYMDLKYEELDRFETHPHPVEFDMYYKA
jgi:glutamine synthetase